jgi:biopolymer transport protein ExbD
MAGGGTGDGEFGLQIAPMLDILFVLLLFFMVSAGSQKHEATISTQLPGGVPQPGIHVPVRLSIDDTGQVSINNAPYDGPETSDLPQTKARLAALVANNKDQEVIIMPQASTHQQRVVDVLNACAAAHVTKIAFGATQ